MVQFQEMKPFLNDDVKRKQKLKRIRVASSTKISDIVVDARQTPFIEKKGRYKIHRNSSSPTLMIPTSWTLKRTDTWNHDIVRPVRTELMETSSILNSSSSASRTRDILFWDSELLSSEKVPVNYAHVFGMWSEVFSEFIDSLISFVPWR